MTPPAHLLALRRHCEDLRDNTHAGVSDRTAKEHAFARAADLLDPVARQALTEANDFLLDRTGDIRDTGLDRTTDGTLARSWQLTWPRQRDRDIAPVTLTAWFGSDFHHPHLRGATVHDWPLNIYAEPDATGLLPVLRAIITADLHNLIFQTDWRIVPAVLE
jgi:hypothetical protein